MHSAVLRKQLLTLSIQSKYQLLICCNHITDLQAQDRGCGWSWTWYSNTPTLELHICHAQMTPREQTRDLACPCHPWIASRACACPSSETSVGLILNETQLIIPRASVQVQSGYWVQLSFNCQGLNRRSLKNVEEKQIAGSSHEKNSTGGKRSRLYLRITFLKSCLNFSPWSS